MSRLRRIIWVAFVMCAFGLLGSDSSAQGGRPTRVLRVPSEAVSRIAALGITPRVQLDYGSYQWLEIAAEDADRLSSEGVPFEDVPGAGEVHVGRYHFDPLVQGVPHLPTRPQRLTRQGGPGDLRLIQFQGPAREEWLQQLEAQGIAVLQYYPHNTYLVRARARQPTLAKGASFVRWQGDLEPAYKIDQGLIDRSGLIRNATITFHNDGDVDGTLAALRDLGARVLRYHPSQPDKALYEAIVELDAGALDAVANLPAVVWLGYESPKPVLNDEMSDQTLAGNVSGGVPTTGYGAYLADLGYDGSGVTWAVVDTGIDWDHPDLASHIVGGYDFPTADCMDPGQPGTDCYGHGTHVAGIVAGDATAGYADANGFLYGLGVAPAAGLFAMNSLSGSAWPPSGGYQEHSKRAVLGGAVGGNNSWSAGSGTTGYQASERTHDLMVRDGNFDTATVAEPFIEVFAAGNAGPKDYTLLSPQTAKNIISVASSLNYREGDVHQLSSFSSRGPAIDGRMLPTITAPGSTIASARNDRGGLCSTPIEGTNGMYAFCSGTSMAAPHVSGALAVIIQWWKAAQGGGANPSPAMAKALLVNSATPMGTTPIPNNAEGWGMLNLDGVIASDAPRVFSDQRTLLSSTGATHAFAVTVADPSKPLKVTLVWTDAPGAAGANPALVNDLDLIVSTAAATYRGNVLANSWSVAGGAADSKNNVENVFIEDPGSDAVVTIRATALNGDGVPYNGDSTDQDFALVCYNCVASAEPTFSLVVLPSIQGVCRPSNASYQAAVTSFNGFGTPVTLAVSGQPDGATATVSPNPVTPTGLPTLTVTGLASVPAGTYTLTVKGSAGATTAVSSAELTVATSLGTVVLSSPAAGAVVSNRPTFSWTAVPGAVSYVLQVATDASFSNVVYSAPGLTEPSHTAFQYLSSGVYYWRVRASNACGTIVSASRSLTTWSVIQGTVKDAVTKSGLANVRVFFYDASGGYVGSAWTSSSGAYATSGLADGTYFAKTSSTQGYVDELFKNVTCAGGGCSVSAGTPISHAAPAGATGINFALDRGGQFSGTVTDGSGAPLADVQVSVLGASGNWSGSAYTDESGVYLTPALPSGTYHATTYNSLGYVDELYDDVPCPGGSCSATGGTPISVTAPNTASGIDFALGSGGHIAGRVTSVSGLPLANVWLQLYDSAGNSMGSVATDGSGSYSTRGLPSGTYFARTYNSLGYLDELYGGILCVGGCSVTSGAPIDVTAPDTTSGIDFALEAGGRIEGRVTSASGSPLANVNIYFYTSAGSWAGSSNTDSAGSYASTGLPGGTYFARTYNSQGYLDEVYSNISCGSSCSVTGGTPIGVVAAGTTSGIDFVLDAGGRVAGRVTSASGSPLANVSIYFYTEAGSSAGYSYTDSTGSYASTALPSGTYHAKTYNALGYVDELYDNVPCPSGSCGMASATSISVTAPQTTSGIDFALDPGGRIAGTVTSTSGLPLANVSVSLYTSAGSWMGSASTDSTGAYACTGLPGGTYFARTYNSQDYLEEIYSNIPCSVGCSATSGTPIGVVAAGTTGGIDFSLDPGGRVAGRVTSASGSPLANVSIYFYDSVGSWLGSASTDATGAYTSGALPSGTFYAVTSNFQGYLDELHSDIPCLGGWCGVTGGTPISVTGPDTTSGIDFALDPGGRITGRVTSASGSPLANVFVDFYTSAGSWAGYSYTDSTGNYASTGLTSGTYVAKTSNWQGYLDELYDDTSCLGGSCSVTGGTPISVTVPGTTSGIDFALDPGGRIAGRVTSASGSPLANVSVRFYNPAGTSMSSTSTDGTGAYISNGLPGGAYYARTSNSLGYLDELYRNIPCVGGSCSVASGTPINVVPPGSTGGIDFSLDPPPAPAIAIGDTAVLEGNPGAAAVFTVSLSGVTPETVTVSYATTSLNGTATSGEDFTPVSGTLRFAPGETRKSVTVPVLDDEVYEGDETFFVTLSSPVNATLADGKGQGTILNDDPPPAVSIGDASAVEGVAETTVKMAFPLSLSRPASQNIAVLASTTDGTAVAGSDYVQKAISVTFLAGETTRTLYVVVNGDGEVEADESFFVNLSSPTPAEVTILDGQGVGTILTDDVGISVNDVQVLEGSSGTTSAAFTVSMASPSSLPVSVTYATTSANGTAEAGTDYTALSGTLSFPPGTTSQTVSVSIAGDTLSEANETFFLKLATPVNAVLARSKGQGTIVNDDPLPGLSIGDVRVTEGPANTTVVATFTITLSQPAGQTITVVATSAGGTALAGSDYIEKARTLTFAPGVTTQTISVVVNGDDEVEPDETFLVNLTGPSPADVTITDGQGVGTIWSDDVGMSIADVLQNEGDSGATAARFTVSLSSPSSLPVSVSYATTSVNGTAEAGTDYTAVSGTLSFPPGTTSQTVAVPIAGDTSNEADETFFLKLAAPANAILTRGKGQGTIVNDDPLPSLSIGDASVVEGAAGTTVNAVFTVSLVPASGQTVTFVAGTADGTALAGSDYVAKAKSLSFAPGETTTTLTVVVNGDGTIEGDEAFFVNLSSPAGATLGRAQGTGTIVSDDIPPSATTEQVVWKRLSGATASGNDLTKTAATGWGDGGAVSTRSIQSGDGYVEFIASEVNTGRMVGLSRGDTDWGYADIDFGAYLAASALMVYEGGVSRGSFGAYAPGDVIRVSVTAGVVTYSRNGVAFYTSGVAPTYPLLVDTALYHSGATVMDVLLSGALQGAPAGSPSPATP